MLRVYVQDQADWEHYLPLVLFAYRTVVHSSTRFSPFELMFSRPALTSPVPSFNTFDVNTYHFQVHSALAQLYKIVWRCTSPRQLTTRMQSMIIMCMNIHSRLATVSGCLFLLQGSWNQAGRGGGRSNPSEDPTPTRLVMAQSCGLCTLTSYSDASNPPL